MKSFKCLLALVLVLCMASISFAGGIGTYSKGYRIGQITKYSMKGMILKSGEGQMLVGIESSRSKKFGNPWYFSSPKSHNDINSALDHFTGEYAVLGYKEYHKKMPNVSTSYEILSVNDILEDKLEESCQVEYFDSAWGDGKSGVTTKSKGKRVGRFVKVSEKGTVVNSYEVTVQQGNSGNNFKNLSILDSKIYECATTALKSAQKVKVFYVESHMNMNVTGRETAYEIVRIEPTKNKFQD